MEYFKSLQLYTWEHYSEIVAQFVNGVFLQIDQPLPIFPPEQLCFSKMLF